MFHRNATIRRVNREGILLLGAQRALLMQIAHPAVAAGVAEHSNFHSDPYGRLKRTLLPVYTVVFGSRAQAAAATQRVWARHEQVVGTGYRATDPDLLLWVYATLVDTALTMHGRFVRPLDEDEAAVYYKDSRTLAMAFGVPEAQLPADYPSFQDYVRHMVADLQVSAAARAIARQVLRPPHPLLAPAAWASRELTAGLLPVPLRRQYGMDWDSRREAVLNSACALSRVLLPVLPLVVRRPPPVFLPRRSTGPTWSSRQV